MQYPVIAADGHTYERHALQQMAAPPLYLTSDWATAESPQIAAQYCHQICIGTQQEG